MQDKTKEICRDEDDGVGAGFEVCVLCGGVVEGNELRDAEVDAGGEEDGGDGYNNDLTVQQDESGMQRDIGRR